MKLLLLSLLLFTGCAVEEYEPAELPSNDCLAIGVCTEMSVLLYDKPENSEYIIDKDGTVNVIESIILRAQEDRLLNPAMDYNAEGFNVIRGQWILQSNDYGSSDLHTNIISNVRDFELQ